MTARRVFPQPIVLALALGVAATIGTASSRVHGLGGPSNKPGIGAIPYTGNGVGVTFRTWAPNAQAVRVAGTFNGWNAGSHPLFAEGDGWWSVDVTSLVAGHQYKFIVVKSNGVQTWKNDPRARRLTNSVGNSIIYNPNAFQWQTTDFVMPDWNELVLYEMHLGTFNVDAGDLPPCTFDEARERLDALEDLGINAITLMPICEFPGDLSWGYNPSYPFSVESSYGTPDDLKEFIDAAHARGIAVMHDLVYSHLGPNDLDMWQFDGWSQNGLGGIFFYNDFRAFTPWGDTRPDYGRPEVGEYLRDNALMWLEEFRMDGHRWDGTKFVRKVDQDGPDIPDGWSLLQWVNDEVDAAQPWKVQIAEDLDNNAWLTKPTGAGGAGFDSQWDAGFVHPVREALITSDDSNRNMWAVRDAIAHSYNSSAFQRVVYTESHDEVANGNLRVPEEIWPGNASSWYSKKRSTLGAVVVMGSPGIPMLFMGQEFLEDGWFADNDPLDWSKATTFSGIRAMYKDLIALRKNAGDVTRGLTGANTNVFHVNNDWKLIAWHRWMNGGPQDDTIVVTNFSNNGRTNYRIGVPQAGVWKCRFNSDWTGYDSSFATWPATDVASENQPWDGMPYSIVLSIGPYTGLVYSQGDAAPPCIAPDLTCDGLVDAADLSVLLGAWGSDGPGDLNDDGTVGAADLSVLLGSWG
ncbi:MAG: alpha-amylase family glycosyl hydrolase [Phycisphaerae bacterium]|nr:alpha-amylase family glycosyl hydrolase [Phycisphaerae bacterium]